MQRNPLLRRLRNYALPLLPAWLTASPLCLAAEEPAFGLYGGLAYQIVLVKAEYEDFQVNAINFLGGKELSEHWAVEGYFSLGLGDDSQTSTQGCIEETFELDNLLGLQIKGHRPLSDRLFAWFTFGLSQTSVSNRVTNSCPLYVGYRGIQADESETDVSYGVGGELRVTPDSRLSLGYVQYYDDGIDSSSLTVRAINIGYRVAF